MAASNFLHQNRGEYDEFQRIRDNGRESRSNLDCEARKELEQRQRNQDILSGAQNQKVFVIQIGRRMDNLALYQLAYADWRSQLEEYADEEIRYSNVWSCSNHRRKAFQRLFLQARLYTNIFL